MSDEPEVARMVYMGRRQLINGTLGYSWAEPDKTDEPGVFTKLAAAAIGHLYGVRVKRDEDGAIRSAWANPSYTGERWDGDRDSIAAWQAADAAASLADRRRKAENRQKKSPELAQALEPLQAVAAKCRSIDEVNALADVVRSKLIRAWATAR